MFYDIHLIIEKNISKIKVTNEVDPFVLFSSIYKLCKYQQLDK